MLSLCSMFRPLYHHHNTIFQSLPRWLDSTNVSNFLVFLPLFRSSIWPRVFPLPEAAIGFISILSKIIALFVLGLGGFFPLFSPWIYCSIMAMASFVYVSLRSALSKITEPSENGQIFAISGLLSTLFGLSSSVAFNYFYGFLISISPGISPLNIWTHGYIFQLVSLICLLLTMPFLWLGFQNINEWSYHRG